MTEKEKKIIVGALIWSASVMTVAYLYRVVIVDPGFNLPKSTNITQQIPMSQNR